MKTAYVDTSCLVAVAFNEPSAGRVLRVLDQYEELYAGNLLEAELLATAVREGVEVDQELMAPIGWVLPDRSLTEELQQVLEAGYLRGADTWHLACALFLGVSPSALGFLTLDERQADQARRLGFAVPLP